MGVGAASAADRIRAELAARNFGRAEQMAIKASAARPGDADLHLLQARAEGYLGKAPEAAAALEQAVLAGLPDRRAAFADPAFDQIRHDAVFRQAEARLLGRGEPARVAHAAAGPAAHAERIRAGDVEISERAGHEVVRAGDLVIDDKD